MFSLFSRKRPRRESSHDADAADQKRPRENEAPTSGSAAASSDDCEASSPLFVEDTIEVESEVESEVVNSTGDVVEDSIAETAMLPRTEAQQRHSPSTESPPRPPPRRAPETPRRFKAPYPTRSSPVSSPQKLQKAGFAGPSHHPSRQPPYRRPVFRNTDTSGRQQSPPVIAAETANRANLAEDLDEGAAGVSTDSWNGSSPIAQRIGSPPGFIKPSEPNVSDSRSHERSGLVSDGSLIGNESIVPDSQPTTASEHVSDQALGKSASSSTSQPARSEHTDVPADTVLNTTSEALINLSPPSMLTPGTQESSQPHTPEKLIRWLQREEGRRAYVLSDFLVKHCDRSVDPELIKESPILADALKSYVVSHDSRVETPIQMQGRHRDIASDALKSSEKFFRQVMYEMRKRQKNTQVELEIIYGPWHDLARAVGRMTIVFILLYTNLYKPVGVAQWLQIAGDVPRAQPRRPTHHQPEQPYVTKRDVVFREFRETEAEQSERVLPLTGRMKHVFPSSLKLMITKVEARARPMRFLFKLVQVNSDGWTPRDRVAKFLSLCCRKTFPREMLGSANNDKALEETIRRFVNMSATAKMPLGQAAHGIKLKDIPWVRQLGPRRANEALSLFWQWLFEHYLKPTLAYHFYMTEMSGAAVSLYYYELSVWTRKIKAAGTQAFIDQHGGKSSLDSGQDGERLRFIPKRSGGVRPIVNLREFNQSLKLAHVVLQSLPRSIARLQSWHDWYLALENFKLRHPIPAGSQYYVVKFDIAGCYDNVNKTRLEQIVRGHLSNGSKEFWLQTYSAFDTQSDLIRDKPSAISAEDLFSASATNTPMLPTQPQRKSAQADLIYYSKVSGNSHLQATRLPPEKQLLHGLPYSGDDVLSDLKMLLHQLTIQVKSSQVVPFQTGIPQGSSCSLDLCNLLLDNFVESKLSDFLKDSRCLLIRYVDDFLFVSTNRELAQLYEKLMLSDLGSEYGVSVKREKEQNNLRARTRRMEYLGYEFDPNTLELYPRKLKSLASMPPVPKSELALVRRMHVDLASLLNVLRSYRRANTQPPYALQKKVSRAFGKFVFDSAEACRASVGESNLATVFQKLAYTKLLPLVSQEHRRPMLKAALNAFNVRKEKKNKK